MSVSYIYRNIMMVFHLLNSATFQILRGFSYSKCQRSHTLNVRGQHIQKILFRLPHSLGIVCTPSSKRFHTLSVKRFQLFKYYTGFQTLNEAKKGIYPLARCSRNQILSSMQMDSEVEYLVPNKWNLTCKILLKQDLDEI